MIIIFIYFGLLFVEKEERGANSKGKVNKDFGDKTILKRCVLEKFKYFNLFLSELEREKFFENKEYYVLM